MQVLEEAVGETAPTWEQDGVAHGEVRESIGGVDETFLERMRVIFQDVPTGYLVLEDIADDRPLPTWQALMEARLKALGTDVFSLVSARAKALIQRAEQGLECLSRPDVFPVVHALSKRSALALGRRVRQAHQELTAAKQALARRQGQPPAEHADAAAQAVVEARPAAVTRWEEAHHTSRQPLETLSLTLHPFRRSDAAPQTSAQVASHRQAAVEAIAAFAQRSQLPVRHDAMTKVRQQGPALAALVDCWWPGSAQDVAPFLLSPMWRSWVHACVLPLVYGAHQAAHTRCARRQAKLRKALESVHATFHTHALPTQVAPRVLEEGQAWALQRTQALQRTSSAVAGRHGS
jgi:Family of unknown function (DUF6399)